MTDPEVAGTRITELLDQLSALPDEQSQRLAEGLLRVVTDLYGAGLARVLEITSEVVSDVAQRQELAGRLAADGLVGSLLVLHGLHPVPLRARVESALDTVRPALSGGDVRILELDEDVGRLRLRLLAGSPFSGAIERRIRSAVEDSVPEIEQIEIDTPPTGPVVMPQSPRGHGAGAPSSSLPPGSVAVELGSRPMTRSGATAMGNGAGP